MDVKKQTAVVDATLKRLESRFDIDNPVGARPNALMLGKELAALAVGGLDVFRAADHRLTEIVTGLLDHQMGAVAGAVEVAFHNAVAEGSTDPAVLRNNAVARRERGR